jgi:PhnB protein
MAKPDPIPADYPRVTPYLSVNNAAAAIDFYCNILGAEERVRMDGPDGKVGHAELAIGNSMIMLADEFPDMGAKSATTIGDTPVTLMVYVEDSDATFKAAIAAGATEQRPVEDQFYGDRSGSFKDPFGHIWFVATHVEDVSPEEMKKRSAEAMQG